MPQFIMTEDKKELTEQLRKNLPRYRSKAGLTQAMLATAIGKSRQWVSEIERGDAAIGWDTYLAMLTVFGFRGALDPRGLDAELLETTGLIIGARLRF